MAADRVLCADGCFVDSALLQQDARFPFVGQFCRPLEPGVFAVTHIAAFEFRYDRHHG